MAKNNYDYDLIVIGSGASGSIAAHLVARAGKRVALVEGGILGGECLNTGCVPTKSLLHAANVYDAAKNGQQFGIRSGAIGYNYPSVKAWKDLAVKRTGADNSKRYHEADGIRVIEGDAHFIEPHKITVNRRHLTAANFLIATGSQFTIPKIEGLDKVNYLTAHTAINLIRPPKSVFIIGASAIGSEFTYLFSVFGSRVYLADIATRILPAEDPETSHLIEDLFTKKRGVSILTSCKVLRVVKEGTLKRVTYERGGEEHSVKVEEVLIASGKSPNTDIGLENAGVEYTAKGITVNNEMQTSAKHIYAAGDVTGGYMFTHVATYESRIAAHNILHREKLLADYTAIPRVTFISPEIASVGLSEDDCIRRDLHVKKAVAPINIIGRSNTSNHHDGFVKVIADKNGVLLGATVVAPHAGEVIHELTLAVQYKMPAAAIANAIHAFPTWSEAVRVACAKI